MQNILVRHIEDDYFTLSYEDLSIVCRVDLGYFNASKLCSSNNRPIAGWYRNSKSKSLMEKYYILKVRFGYEAILGHYFHPDLFINIASWISPEIYFKSCHIITKFSELKYQFYYKRHYESIIHDQNLQIQKINFMLMNTQKQLTEKITEKKIYNDPRDIIKNL